MIEYGLATLIFHTRKEFPACLIFSYLVFTLLHAVSPAPHWPWPWTGTALPPSSSGISKYVLYTEWRSFPQSFPSSLPNPGHKPVGHPLPLLINNLTTFAYHHLHPNPPSHALPRHRHRTRHLTIIFMVKSMSFVETNVHPDTWHNIQSRLFLPGWVCHLAWEQGSEREISFYCKHLLAWCLITS